MKKYFYCAFLAVLFLGFLMFAPPASAANTFPVESAGMAAYVKLDAFTLANFENAKKKLFDWVEATGETHVVGVKEYEVDDIIRKKINFHIYLGTNGWLVVYLLKKEEPSRIVNWHSGTPLSETMLKVAADDVIQKIGASAAGQLKYYNFAYPQAEKITLAKQKLSDVPSEIATDTGKTINIFVPGTLYQGSFSVLSLDQVNHPETQRTGFYLDGAPLAPFVGSGIRYGIYGERLFAANKKNSIFLLRGGINRYVAAVSVIIYKTN